MEKQKINIVWCKTKRGKTKAQREACHKLLYGKKAKLPKRKYKRRS